MGKIRNKHRLMQGPGLAAAVRALTVEGRAAESCPYPCGGGDLAAEYLRAAAARVAHLHVSR